MEKTTLSKPATESRPLRKKREAPVPSAAEPQAAAAPRTPADIPGLGPIRVRALQKAGFDSLDALRAARLEDLLTVPGLSEIKARHIQDFLARSPAAPEPKPKRTSAEPVPFPTSDLAAAAEQAQARIQALLSRDSGVLRGRLLHALEGLAAAVETLRSESARLPEKIQERLARRLRRIVAELPAQIGPDDFDRKAQGRLADSLAKAGAKLAASE
jgi:hypothetical protein